MRSNRMVCLTEVQSVTNAFYPLNAIVLVALPEPATFVLLSLAGAPMLLRRRRSAKA